MSNSRKRKQKKKKAKIATNQHKLNKLRKTPRTKTILSSERRIEIEQEAKRRVDEWLKHSSFDEMSVMGSKMRFDMSLGLFGGYPFEEPEWMLDKSFNSFITEEEFNSSEYEKIIDNLFDKTENIN
ncbi:hypothetical protein [Tenacibaculum sp.]|uniref:hypothetical protein n=1 Tax=Tenacibaculum sp. TaxID=1906242 RepID=UPI003AA8295D